MSWTQRIASMRAQNKLDPADPHWGMPLVPDDSADAVTDARQAFAAGNQLFQVDIPLACVQGWYGIGQVSTRTLRPEPDDILGAIEAEGWRLEHVSTSYLFQGSSATKRRFAYNGSTFVANHGMLVGVYVFRRRD